MEYLNKVLSMLDENANASATLGLFLVLYAGLAAPKLPKNVALLFDNSAFKLTIMFLIAYMSSRNSSVAIVATVALVVSLQTLSMYQTNDIILDAVKDKEVVKVTTEEQSEEYHVEHSEENTMPMTEEYNLGEEMNVSEENTMPMTEEYNLGEEMNVSEENTVAELVNSEESIGESEEQASTESEEPRKKTNKLNNVIGWGGSDYAQV